MALLSKMDSMQDDPERLMQKRALSTKGRKELMQCKAPSGSEVRCIISSV
jgi:hypothetical protein